jgi:hypothetical protein
MSTQSLVRDYQMADAARKAAAAEVVTKIEADKTNEQRAAAALKEAQTMRRNAWINHLLVTAPAGTPLDINAIETGIPAAPDAWPPGFDSSLVVFGTTKTETPQAVEVTLLGKLQKGEKL